MRQSLGLVFSIFLHASLAVFVIYWANGQGVRINMDRPVYTVDLVTLAPPPPAAPTPVVEAVPEAGSDVAEVPVVEAKAEPIAEVPETPVVEAKSEPKVEKISPKKVEKKTIIKKKKEKPKPKPKPKPKKTAKQLLAEGLATAKAAARKEDQKKKKALEIGRAHV